MSENEIKWEIPVEAVPLPTNGKIYSPESFFYEKETVEIKSMTAKEEDILSSQAYIKKGTVLTELIKSCVMSQEADPNDLILGDRTALTMAIRITGYGSNYDVGITCRHCGENNQKNVSLTELGIKPLEIEPVESGKNVFEYILPVSKKRVLFKFLTGKDENEKNKNIESMQKIYGENFLGNITKNIESHIIEIDGVQKRSEIKKFIDIMPAYDSKSLRSYIKKSEPGIETVFPFSCDHCSAESEVDLPITTNFFWPTL